MELTRLRAATALQHKELEESLDLLRSSFTLEQYIALLKRFYGFHQAWEPEIEVFLEPEVPGFFAPRRKLPNVAADLRYLGAATEDLLGISPCTRLPALTSMGAALGSLYVIEGSSLGGRILTRHFGEHLGMRPDAGCRFFAGYGERTGQMWTAFAELVAGRPDNENEEMLTAAVSTFQSLGEWLGGGVNA